MVPNGCAPKDFQQRHRSAMSESRRGVPAPARRAERVSKKFWGCPFFIVVALLVADARRAAK
eukprot:10100827-Lingulodinium_polyedra.AAC.1